MKSENQNESAIAIAITRESVRAGIARSASAIGCDRTKTVSGTQLLIIFIRELEACGVLPPDYNRTAAIQIASSFDANSSAMTKRLYESGPASKEDKIAAMAAMLGAPV